MLNFEKVAPMVAAQFLKLSGLSDQTLGKVEKELYVWKWGGEGGGGSYQQVDLAVSNLAIRYWIVYHRNIPSPHPWILVVSF